MASRPSSKNMRTNSINSINNSINNIISSEQYKTYEKLSDDLTTFISIPNIKDEERRSALSNLMQIMKKINKYNRSKNNKGNVIPKTKTTRNKQNSTNTHTKTNNQFIRPLKTKINEKELILKNLEENIKSYTKYLNELDLQKQNGKFQIWKDFEKSLRIQQSIITMQANYTSLQMDLILLYGQLERKRETDIDRRFSRLPTL